MMSRASRGLMLFLTVAACSAACRKKERAHASETGLGVSPSALSSQTPALALPIATSGRTESSAPVASAPETGASDAETEADAAAATSANVELPPDASTDREEAGPPVAASASSAPGSATCPKRRSPDAPAATTADGKITVFVAIDATREDTTAMGPTPHQDLCVVKAGAAPALLLAGHSAPEDGGPEDTLTGFGNLVFDTAGRTLYFTTAAWVTSPAAHAVDIATGKTHFLFDGAIASPITRGVHRGMLLAWHLRLDNTPIESPNYRGRIETWSVVTPDGKTVRTLPEDPNARKAILGER